MWTHLCIQLLLLGVAFVNATPAWFYNTGIDNAAPSEVGCSSFTREYDPHTGHFTYRCNTAEQKSNYLSIPNGYIGDIESNEDASIMRQSLQTSGRSRTTYSKPIYKSVATGRSQVKKRNNKPKRPTNSNNKPRRPSNSRRNRCPPGQMFQSELDICIEYPLGPPLPPKQPSNTRQTMFDRMLGDAPARVTANRQRAPAAGTILSVRKYDLNNHCKPNEIFVSELNMCLPGNNCFPYGTTC